MTCCKQITSPPAIPAIICTQAHRRVNNLSQSWSYTASRTLLRAQPDTHLLGELMVWRLSISRLVLLILTHGEEGGSTLQHRHPDIFPAYEGGSA